MRRNEHNMVTVFETVEMLAALSLQNRGLEAYRRFLAILKPTTSTQIQTPDHFIAGKISLEFINKMNQMRLTYSLENRLGLQKLRTELANFHYASDINRIRESFAFNSVILPNLLYASLVRRIDDRILSSVTGKSIATEFGNEHSGETLLHQENRRIDSTVKTDPKSPSISLELRSRKSEASATSDMRTQPIRAARELEGKFLPLERGTDIETFGAGTSTMQEVLKVPRILQAAVQAIGKWGQIKLQARTPSSGKFKVKDSPRVERFFPLQSYIMTPGEAATGQTHGMKQKGDVPSRISSSRSEPTKRVKVPGTPKSPIFTIAHRTIAGLSGASAGGMALSVPALLQLAMREIMPAASRKGQAAKELPELGTTRETWINKHTDESPRSGLNLHVVAIEGLTRGFPRLSQADSSTSAIERDPLKLISSINMARQAVALQTGDVMMRAARSAYMIGASKTDSVRPRAAESIGLASIHSREEEPIAAAKFAQSSLDGTSKDNSAAASLQQAYSSFTLDNLIRKRKGGVVAAMLLTLRKSPGNLVSMPPRKVESRNRREKDLDPKKLVDGSLELPHVSQLRAMLAEYAIRRIDSGLMTPIAAFAQQHASPPSTAGLRRAMTRQSYPQNQKKQEDIHSAYRSSPTAGHSNSSSSRYSESNDRHIGRDVRSVSVSTPERSNNLSLRDLRKMMEQIFQDELKRYGL